MATVWRKAFGDRPTTVSEAVVKAEEKKTAGTWEGYKSEPVNPELNEAFMAIARRGTAISPEAIGKYLSSEAERVVALETGAKVRFEKAGTRQGAVLWTLVVVAAEAEEDVPFN
jgi:hypothetical protein